MDYIDARAKVTPILDPDGSIRVVLEWVDGVGEVHHREEWVTKPNRLGCSYVSRMIVERGDYSNTACWIDEQGLRHFVIDAQVGQVGAVGGNM